MGTLSTGSRAGLTTCESLPLPYLTNQPAAAATTTANQRSLGHAPDDQHFTHQSSARCACNTIVAALSSWHHRPFAATARGVTRLDGCADRLAPTKSLAHLPMTWVPGSFGYMLICLALTHPGPEYGCRYSLHGFITTFYVRMYSRLL